MVSMQAIRNFVRDRLAAYGALALASLTLGATTAGAAEIIVTWVLVHQEIRPQQGLRHSNVSVRLSLRGVFWNTARRSTMGSTAWSSVNNAGGDHAPVKLITSLGPLTWGCFIVS